MNIYDARWKNALKQAEKANKLLDEGCMIFDQNGDKVFKFEIDHEERTIRERISENTCIVFFIGDGESWNGSDETIEEYNKTFDGWKVIRPEHAKDFLKTK